MIQGKRELASELDAARKGEPRPVYLLFGSEPYLVRTGADALVRVLADRTDAEVVRVDAAGKGAAAVLEPVATLSLFASAKIVVVRNFSHLLAGDGADALLATIDAGLAEGSSLVFVAPGGPTGEKIDKRLKGTKGLLERGIAIELNTQRPEDLSAWLCEEAAKEGKALTGEAARLLLGRAGADMGTLRSELDKALLYCLDAERIEAADLQKLVGKSREDAVWDISEAVALRDAARAMELVEDLLAAGNHPLVLLTLLIRQARHLLQARLLWDDAGRPPFRDPGSFRSRVASSFEAGAFGKGPDDVTSIHPFACFKRFEMARAHEVPELRHLIARLRRADRGVKTGAGSNARAVLEELILDLCATGGAARRAA